MGRKRGGTLEIKIEGKRENKGNRKKTGCINKKKEEKKGRAGKKRKREIRERTKNCDLFSLHQ